MTTQTLDPASPSAPDNLLDEELLTSDRVMKMIGVKTAVTFWRWRKNYGFPEPYMTVGGLNYWTRGVVRAWIAERHKETKKLGGEA